MTKLLVRLFIKDYNNTDNVKVRTSYGVLVSTVGILCNITLFAIKLTIGLIISSISVMADAFNNLSDAASSVIGLVGAKVAGRPADKEHPFGHGRAEYIAAFIVSFLILQVGLTCFKSSFQKIIKPEEVGFNFLLVVILCLSVLMKLWLSIFNKKLGNKINSSVMKATAADALGDVFITSATIISIIVSKITGLKIDGYMGVIVSVMVLIAGYNIAKETLEPLLGEAVDRELYQKITEKVESYKGIIGSHDLIIHNYGPSRIMATLHVEVPNYTSMEEAHEVIDLIERDILREMGIFIVLHTDPVEILDPNVTLLKEKVIGIVSELEPQASIHDFRIVEDNKSTKLIFDMLLPYSYDKEKEKRLIESICQKMEDKNKAYECIITIDNNFIAEK
jgi:cation diffusion facilitator family transporter